MKRVAVVLFNLGGPESPEAVQPFLFNLFWDPAIIGAPAPFRWFLAKLISSRRAPIAREIYAHLGGGSPLLENTRDQADALTKALEQEAGDRTFRVFVAMRYWHPFAAETARAVAEFKPDDVILLPLYPQFSTTTTASSFADWERAARKAGVAAKSRAVCCFPQERGFVNAMAALIREALAKVSGPPPRVLFSAHGLPKKVIDRGDPYQWQVEQSAAAVVDALRQADLDWVVCYQSRVGPLEWIGPSTEAEIERAGRDGKPVLIVPVAFVSEHSETLVELDIEYRELAEQAGVPGFARVPTVSTRPEFIAGLVSLVTGALGRDSAVAPDGGRRQCPGDWTRCPCATAVAAATERD